MGLCDDAERNIISANNGSGIAIVGSDSGQNSIVGNHIGVGPTAKTLGNLEGVLINARDNRIFANTIASNEAATASQSSMELETRLRTIRFRPTALWASTWVATA